MLSFRSQDPRLLVVFLVILFNHLGNSMVNPTLSLYAQRHFGVSPEAISLLLTVFYIAQFAAAPLLGSLSDRFGRLPVLLVCLFGTFISFIVMGFAGTFWLLVAARVLDGVTGGNIIVAQAYVADITSRETRTAALGYVWAGFGVGFIVGPAIGGMLAGLLDDRAPFFIGAAFSVLTMLIAWRWLNEPLTPQQRAARRVRPTAKLTVREVAANSPLLLVLLLGFAMQFTVSIVQSTIALFGEHVVFAEYSPQQASIGVGLLLTGLGVGQLITQLAILPRLLRRYDEGVLLVGASIVRSISFLSLVVFTSPFLVGPVSLVLMAGASGVIMPPLSSLVTQTVGDSRSGAALGLYQAVANIGIIIGAALSGNLFAASPRLPWLICGILLVVMVAPALSLKRRRAVMVAA